MVKLLTLAASCASVATALPGAQSRQEAQAVEPTSSLIISRVVYGKRSNKQLTISNPTDKDIKLADINIRIKLGQEPEFEKSFASFEELVRGKRVPGQLVVPTTVIKSGESLTVCSTAGFLSEEANSMSIPDKDGCDFIDDEITRFNGNDGIRIHQVNVGICDTFGAYDDWVWAPTNPRFVVCGAGYRYMDISRDSDVILGSGEVGGANFEVDACEWEVSRPETRQNGFEMLDASWAETSDLIKKKSRQLQEELTRVPRNHREFVEPLIGH